MQHLNASGPRAPTAATPLHFTPGDYASRQQKARKALQAQGLDAILTFAPKSHLRISGYDTFGFAMFQCMVLIARNELHLLNRTPDLRQAPFTSTPGSEDIHIWHGIQGANPAQNLAELLQDLGVTGPIAYESNTVGLTDHTGRALHAALPGLIDASDLIRTLRRVKSPAEIEMHRHAAALSDGALDKAVRLDRPGAFEGDILAAMQGAVFNPIWVDLLTFHEGNRLVMQAGQIFFLHMILMDGEAGQAMTLGDSVLVKPGVRSGCRGTALT